MWSTKAWDDMKRILPDDNNGSRVILTTRLSEVATYADPASRLHHMQVLNDDRSWDLLQKKVFAEERCPLELENIGKTIAQKCRGLPLAIVLVAGLLSKIARTANHWEQFGVNVGSTLATDGDHLFKVLSLSYNNLPHHLRACFLYMGGFPEDSEILISRLTKLWTAEGFIKPVRSKSLEKVGEDNVKDLVKRNLISITKKSSTGRFRVCRVHDILRDFCIQIAQHENFLHVTNSGSTSQEGIESKRRVCYTSQSLPPNVRCSLARSLLFFNKRHSQRFSIFFRLLRVLSGTQVCVDLLHPEATKLFHLRYLSFSYHSIDFVVPASISELRNLQTLIIQHNVSGSVEWLKTKLCLPSEIWKMPKLRHIIVHNYCVLPVHVDSGIGGNTCGLKNLQTLSKVGNFSFTRETIRMIPNLKKLAVVYYIDGSTDPPEIHLSNLRHLYQLETLKFMVARLGHWRRNILVRRVAFPHSLKRLTLSGCGFSWKGLSVVGRLPNLEVLKLQHGSVFGEEWKPVEGEFLRLKFLILDDLEIKCWLAEQTHFPSLERLIIVYCKKLEEVPSGIGDIPTLQSIEVADGTKSAGESAFRIQEEQQSYGNVSLRVHVRDHMPESWIAYRVTVI